MRGFSLRPRLTRAASAIRFLFRNAEQGAVFEPYNPDALLQRRNLLTYSEVFANSAYTKQSTTINTGAGSAVTTNGMGTLALDEIVTTNNTNAQFWRSVVLTSGQVFTASVHLKRAVVTDWVLLELTNSGFTAGNRYWFNITTGALGSSAQSGGGLGALTTPTITPCGDGLYRISAGATATGTINVSMTQVTGDNSTTRVAAASSVYGYGMQVDLGPLTPYQKVTDWNTEYLAAAGSLITLYQDSAGTTPVTAVGQPVGMVLDKRLGLVRGAEMSPNPGPFSATTGFVFKDTGTPIGGSLAGGQISVTGATSPRAALLVTGLTVGQSYELICNVVSVAGGCLPSVAFAAADDMTSIAAQDAASGTTGNRRVQWVANATTVYIGLRSNVAGTFTFGGLSIKSLPGNHATQSTAAARPTPSARYNLLQKTEDISDVFWNKNNITVSGTDTLVDNTANLIHQIVNQTAITVPNGSVYVGQADVYPMGKTWAYVTLYDGVADHSAYINLTTGTLGAQTGSPTFTLTPLGGGGWRVNVRATMTGTGLLFAVGAANGDGVRSYVGTGVAVLRVTKLDVRAAGDAALNIPAYQRVNTATDYDGVGFPFRHDFDGVDDNLSAAAGGGVTTGFFYCGVIRVTGGAGLFRSLWTDRGTNTGYQVRLSDLNQLTLLAGNGTAYVAAVTPQDTIAVGSAYIVTAWDDGTNLNVQINQGAVASIARPAVVAGTAGFSEGSFNNSQFFTGGIFSRIYRAGTPPDAATRARVQRELARKAGMVL